MTSKGSELAKQLGVNRSRITQLHRQGLPRRRDGLFNTNAALMWIAKNCCSSLGGDDMRRGRSELATRAENLLRKMAAPPKTSANLPVAPSKAGMPTQARQSARELLEAILAKTDRIPELMVSLGVNDVALIVATKEIFEMAILDFAGPTVDQGYEVESEEIAAPAFNVAAFAKKAGLLYKRKTVEPKIDELVQKAYLFFSPAPSQEPSISD